MKNCDIFHIFAVDIGRHDDVRDNNALFVEILSTLKAIKSSLKGHMINRIFHSWSFHIKFIKLSEGSFDKFHMKLPLVQFHGHHSYFRKDFQMQLAIKECEM